MSKLFRFSALAAMAIVVVGLCLCWRGCGRNRNALARYKAELRAKGEKLSAAELGYPRPLEKSPGLDHLLATVSKLGAMRFQPSSFDFMPFSGPGQVKPVWGWSHPMTHDGRKAYDWETVSAQFTNGESITLELREAVRIPPRCFYNDPTNFSNTPRGPFIALRSTAQWLAGDAMVALHARRVDQAALDIRALARLAQFHREDLTLVSQMIRVAISGLGLSVTWQALQAEGWSEEQLAGLQRDWESVNLADAFEAGMLGERAFGGAAFDLMRTASSRERLKFIRLSSTTGQALLKSPQDYFDAFVVIPFWAANSEADEMLFLRHNQRNLESIRKLRAGVPWPQISSELNSNFMVLNTAFSSQMAKYRYLISAMTIPNFVKAGQTTVRNEMQRRMTVTAIALARHRQRSGAFPANLDALVPEFLSAVPIDLMSNQPLCYRLNSDGTFTLYSIGEDGRDDGGDPTQGTAMNQFDLWFGRDAVWPIADTKN